MLLRKEQLYTAEEAALRAIDLLPEEGEQLWVYESHRVLGQIYQSKDEMEEAVRHLEMALRIASSLNQTLLLFGVYYDLADMFSRRGKFGDAQIHVEHTKSFAANNAYNLARTSLLQARLWYKQDMFGEARSEALAALENFEKLGSADYAGDARRLLRQIDARWPGQPDCP